MVAGHRLFGAQELTQAECLALAASFPLFRPDYVAAIVAADTAEMAAAAAAGTAGTAL